MASTLLDKLDESLKCGICLENFRSPRGLPCLHSFCEECLERWAKKSEKPGVLTCPNCSKDAQIPEGGVTEFPAHFLVNSLQESVDMEKTKEECAVCGLCDNSGKATSYCVDCDDFMCDTCHSSHKKFKAMKDHQVVTIEEFRAGKVTKPLKKRYCDKHDEEQIKFYCKTCDKLVCRDCIVMKDFCRDHEYCILKEAAQSKADCLRGTIKECQESKKKCQSAVQDVEKLESDLIENLNEVIAALSTEKKDLQDVMAKIDRACDLGTKLTDSRSDMEILSNYSTIMETLQEAHNTKSVTVRSARVSAIMENLQEASNTKPVPAEIPVTTYPDTSARTYIKNLKPWNEVGEYSTQGGQPIGITTTPGDDIAILFSDKVKVFSWSGDIKHSFSSPPNGSGIACMMDGKYVIAAKDAKKCFIYDAEGAELSSFQVLGVNGEPAEPAEPVSVAMDNQGNIIIGLTYLIVHNIVSQYGNSYVQYGYQQQVASLPTSENRFMLSTHSSTGTSLSKFQTSGMVQNLAVTGNGNIAVLTSSNFQLMDSSGKTLKCPQQPPKHDPNENDWIPCALCCSKKDGLIFVANKGQRKGVYMYTSDGEYLKCVTTKVEDCHGVSYGVSLSQDGQRLVVSNNHQSSFKIFQRP